MNYIFTKTTNPTKILSPLQRKQLRALRGRDVLPADWDACWLGDENEKGDRSGELRNSLLQAIANQPKRTK